jgi:hybrid cluster-associated redox disulfide protein
MTDKNFELSVDSNILETIENYPEAAEIFIKHGLPCLGCAAARFEKLSDVVAEFGIDVDKLIADLKASKK